MLEPAKSPCIDVEKGSDVREYAGDDLYQFDNEVDARIMKLETTS